MFAYILLRLASLIAPRVPRRFGYAVLGIAAAVWYRVAPSSRRMIQSNVRHVLGEGVDQARIDVVSQQIFHNLLKNYFDLFWLPAQPTDDVARLVVEHGYEHLGQALAMGKGVIVVTMHLGNQEMMTQLRAITDVQLTVVVEHVKNERVYRYMTALRQSPGLRLIPQDGALKELLRALKRGEVIGLVFDRDVTDSGRVIPFFGSPAKLPDGYAILALRFGAPILPSFVVRQPDDSYAVYVEPPMQFTGRADSDADVRRVMLSVGAVVEKYIAKYLEQWVYFHYVWDQDKKG